MIRFLRMILAATCIALPAQAQTQTDPLTLPPYLLRQLQQDPQQTIRHLIDAIFKLNAEGYVTQDILETRTQMGQARSLAQTASRAFQFDLNGDLTISADEIAKQEKLLSTREKTELETLLATADSNKDGALSGTEIMTSYAANMRKRNPREIAMFGDLTLFDRNKDGRVDTREVADQINDWVASGAIQHAKQTPRRSQTQAAAPLDCKMPKPSKAAEVVVIGAYEGAAISTVAVSGQDRETSLATLHIEPGRTPLYLVATALDSIVWRLTGATERVEMMLASHTQARGAGITGIAKDKVAFPQIGCLPKYFYKPADGKALRAKAQVQTALAHPVTHLVGKYDIATMQIPSGKMTKSSAKARPKGITIIQGDKRYLMTKDGPVLLEDSSGQPALKRVEAMLRRFYPEGIVRIDPSEVHASNGAEAYEVLPQQAGLIQLIAEGKMKRTSDGYFHIIKPVARFPAGLNGAHSVKFLIGKGVPMPKGSPGHSSVYMEETGQCAAGMRCR